MGVNGGGEGGWGSRTCPELGNGLTCVGLCTWAEHGTGNVTFF